MSRSSAGEASFRKALESRRFASVYYFHGDDDYLKEQALQRPDRRGGRAGDARLQSRCAGRTSGRGRVLGDAAGHAADDGRAARGRGARRGGARRKRHGPRSTVHYRGAARGADDLTRSSAGAPRDERRKGEGRQGAGEFGHQPEARAAGRGAIAAVDHRPCGQCAQCDDHSGSGRAVGRRGRERSHGLVGGAGQAGELRERRADR